MEVLKEELLGAPAFSPTDSISADFCTQKLWGHVFLPLELRAVGSGVGLGLPCPEIFLLNFYQPHVGVRPILCLGLSYQCDRMWFLLFDGFQTSIHLDF